MRPKNGTNGTGLMGSCRGDILIIPGTWVISAAIFLVNQVDGYFDTSLAYLTDGI